MRFEKFTPTEQLKPYVKYFVVSENELENEYKVFPSSGLVIGFQYKGELSALQDGVTRKLASAGITGMSDSYKIFTSSAHIGTVLVYFTETGFAHFASSPTHELFNMSISLDDIFEINKVNEVKEKLAEASTDSQRIKIVERFLLSQLRNINADRLITAAVKLIYRSNGTIRIKELNQQLCISQSPFEKRFRSIVGTTPKKFASIVRFNTIIDNFEKSKSLTEICYENNFFDQSHFIRDFKRFTGNTPESFKRLL